VDRAQGLNGIDVCKFSSTSHAVDAAVVLLAGDATDGAIGKRNFSNFSSLLLMGVRTA
jgi:hypothetical protein